MHQREATKEPDPLFNEQRPRSATQSPVKPAVLLLIADSALDENDRPFSREPLAGLSLGEILDSRLNGLTDVEVIRRPPGSLADIFEAALAALDSGSAPSCILVHLISHALTPATVINSARAAVDTGGSIVVPALPIVDTIKTVIAGPEPLIETTVDRSRVRELTSPWGFSPDAVRAAVELLRAESARDLASRPVSVEALRALARASADQLDAVVDLVAGDQRGVDLNSQLGRTRAELAECALSSDADSDGQAT